MYKCVRGWVSEWVCVCKCRSVIVCVCVSDRERVCVSEWVCACEWFGVSEAAFLLVCVCVCVCLCEGVTFLFKRLLWERVNMCVCVCELVSVYVSDYVWERVSLMWLRKWQSVLCGVSGVLCVEFAYWCWGWVFSVICVICMVCVVCVMGLVRVCWP